MRNRVPSPAMVVALLALLVALGGTTYAATKISKNSVGTKAIKQQAVTAAKLAANAVTTQKIAANAVTNEKIAGNAVTSGRVQDGTLTRADSTLGTLVTAYGRINNGAGDPVIAPGAVNVTDLDVIGGDGIGNLIITFNGLPAGGLATCSIVGQPVLSPATLVPLSRRSIMFATGGGSLDATSAQVTTMNELGGNVDYDFYVQVSCAPG